MAHNAYTTSLTQDLVKATLSGQSVDKFTRLALSTFANAHSGRTNQFDVTARLEGLEEKARILNNDPLADALHDRLQELSLISNKWTPEVLSLLLQLSDRPVQESRVEDLKLLRPDTSPAPLTWADIIADDPLDDEDGIWKDIDYRDNESNEDNQSELNLADSSSEICEEYSSNDYETARPHAEDLIDPDHHKKLEQIRKAQFWKTENSDGLDPILEQKDDQPKILITESQLVCEVVFMLLGLPTSVYTISSQTGPIALSQTVGLRHVSHDSTTTLLNSFAEIGDKLLNVRRWIGKTTAIPLEQTFQASLASRLNELDSALSMIEARMLDHRNEITLSLLALYEEVSVSSRLIQQTSEILMRLARLPESELPFQILEYLFEVSCTNQMIGDSSAYEYMARLFFDCLHTYQRPIRLWAEKGLLDEQDRVIFIKENQTNVPLSSLWQDKFHLVKDPSGNLHAPSFLHLASRKIFNSGKCVDFLRHLGYEPDEPQAQSCDESSISFENVCGSADDGSLSPFPVLFDLAFDRWIAGMHLSSSSMLRERLDKGFGLQRSLDALEYIHFCRNGALSSNFTFALFERIERGHLGWNDSFTLTELIQNAYRGISSIDPEQLQVRTRIKTSQRGLRHVRRPMAVLEDVHINYILPWPIANIIKTDCTETYQRVSILLMQIQRAKYLLQRQKPSRQFQKVVAQSSSLIDSTHHRLLWFTNTMLTYITQMVLSATSTSMRSSMKLALDVDGMIEVHDTYITQLKHQCFLTKQHASLHQAIVSLLDLTVLYSDIEASHATHVVSKTKPLSGDVNASSKPSLTRVTSGIADSDSSDDSDSEAGAAKTDSLAATAPSEIDNLNHIGNTFSRLHTFIAATVLGVSKADSAPYWEMLASSLAAGQG